MFCRFEESGYIYHGIYILVDGLGRSVVHLLHVIDTIGLNAHDHTLPEWAGVLVTVLRKEGENLVEQTVSIGAYTIKRRLCGTNDLFVTDCRGKVWGASALNIYFPLSPKMFYIYLSSYHDTEDGDGKKDDNNNSPAYDLSSNGEGQRMSQVICCAIPVSAHFLLKYCWFVKSCRL